jgi:hypothetical protein
MDMTLTVHEAADLILMALLASTMADLLLQAAYVFIQTRKKA